MGKAGSSKDYDYGQKNNWRRAIWNEVLRRTAGREKVEPVLYLAGPDDLDRAVAISKGVPNQNLIAIDRDVSNVLAVRDRQSPAVSGDVIDVLGSWPDKTPACAVFLDFCSGLEAGTWGVYDLFERKPLRNAVVAVNFMRGRDPSLRGLRELLDQTGLCPSKHRARQFLYSHAFEIAVMAIEMMRGQPNPSKGGMIHLWWPADPMVAEFMRSMITTEVERMEPRFLSYRSGPLVFDSAVFRPTSRFIDQLHSDGGFNAWRTRVKDALGLTVPSASDMETEVMQTRRVDHVPKVARRVNAVLAIRTMRLSRGSRLYRSLGSTSH